MDSTLLEGFIDLSYPSLIADLGSGSGVIGLMLARRYPKAKVVLVELQEGLYELSMRNVIENGLKERVRVLHTDIRLLKGTDLPQNHFDLIVSNPPFRKEGTGSVSPCRERAFARHEVDFSLDDLFNTSFYLLRGKGRLCFIYHTDRFVEVIERLRQKRLEAKRIRFVHHKPDFRAELFLIEAVKEGHTQCTIMPPLFIDKGLMAGSQDTL